MKGISKIGCDPAEELHDNFLDDETGTFTGEARINVGVAPLNIQYNASNWDSTNWDIASTWDSYPATGVKVRLHDVRIFCDGQLVRP